MPTFSVIVPAYNAQDTLAETLDAILAQTHQDWECVVVDDGSTDSTLGIAETYARRDARFRVISQANQGTAGAYNTGVAAAEGHYIAICSADDILLPEHLSAMAGLASEEPASKGILSSNGYYLDPDGTRRIVYGPGAEVPVTFLETIVSCFYSVGAVYPRRVFDEIGGYRSGTFAEDYDFWLRAMAAGIGHTYHPEALSLHRVSATQKSADVVASHRSAVLILRRLRRTARLDRSERYMVSQAIRIRREAIANLGGRPERDWQTMRRWAVSARRRIGFGR